jgi:hypothetical protein
MTLDETEELPREYLEAKWVCCSIFLVVICRMLFEVLVYSPFSYY